MKIMIIILDDVISQLWTGTRQILNIVVMAEDDEKALKKAMRRYFKTKNKNQKPDHEWTAFRAAEKRFKAQFPSPDLQTVLDLRALSTPSPESNQGVTGNPYFIPTRIVGTNPDQKV